MQIHLFGMAGNAMCINETQLSPAGQVHNAQQLFVSMIQFGFMLKLFCLLFEN